jgi:catechol 2,3-dioxygenase-like lactoylglutathione lyase family enzyme
MLTDAILSNLNPQVGARYDSGENVFGLMGLDHFALPTRNLKLLERFVREILGGEPYYYAGFDETDRELGRKPHIFLRVGNVLFQCTEENSPAQPDKRDPHISPHWAFQATAAGLDANTDRLRSAGIPVQGPMQHRGIDCTSIYFLSPEGHKFEICTWEAYPAHKTLSSRINWAALAHDWPNVKADQTVVPLAVGP